MPIDERGHSRKVEFREHSQWDREDVVMPAIVGAGFILGILLLASASKAEDEFQLWVNPADVALNLSEDFRATVQAQLRYDDGGSLVRQHSDMGIVYTGLTDWLHAGINYRLIFRRVNNEEWKQQNRVHLNFTARGKLLGMGLSNRVRFEYNSLKDVGDYQTIRNKISLNPPLEFAPNENRRLLGRQTLKPFASYEIFYDTFDHAITRHRSQAGISVTASKNIKGEVSYMRSDRSSTIELDDLNIVFMRLRLQF